MPKLRPAPEEQNTEEELLKKTVDKSEEKQITASSSAEDEPPIEQEQEDAALALQKQLDELRKSEELQRKHVTNLRQERDEALKRSREREAEIVKFQKEARDSEFDAISSALAAANAEAEKAQLDIENAVQLGDTKAQAEAYRRLAKAESKISTLEVGKDHIETSRKEAAAAPQQQQQQDPIEASGLPDTAKDWLRAHPDYMRDPRKNAKIQSLHWDVLDEGHRPFSAEYFDSLETHLGIRQKSQQQEPQENQQQQRTSIVSAPVSREVPNATQNRSTGQIRLSAAQREAAKAAGVTEKVYAEQLQKLNDMRANGSYGDRQ